MKNIFGAAIAPLMTVLVLAAVACENTPAASPGPSEPTPAQDITPESSQPPVTSGSPLASLRFEGVDYVQSGYAEFLLGEVVASFTIDGTEIAVDDLEVVGRSEGMLDGLDVYQIKDAETNEVYTFSPGKDVRNPEDGRILKVPDTWTQWSESAARDEGAEDTPRCIRCRPQF